MAKVTVSGGDKIGAALRKLFGRAAPVLRVGIFEDKRYPGGMSVALAAAYSEFGTPNARFPAPPRPVYRPVIDAGKTTWGPIVGEQMKQGSMVQRLLGGNPEGALRVLGEVIVGELMDQTIAVGTPPLSATTVMLRSMRRSNPNLVVNYSVVQDAQARVRAGRTPRTGTSTKPLVDTGVRLHSYSYEIGVAGGDKTL